jgi:1-acyl-sn-glycerol-3-phosphate acyltransferase
LAGIPRPVVPIAKIEIKKIPVLSWAMLAAGHIFVDRSDHKKALESMEKARKSLARKPRSILIFPEGTRSLDGKIQPFKKGGIIFAINSGLPIVPMACCGTFDVLFKGSKNFNPKPVELRFAQPIHTEQDNMDQRNRITKQVHDEVERLKNEWAAADQ